MEETVIQPHIRCSEKDAARYAVLPGDPKRVGHAAKFLDNVKEICFNREYKSITGFYNGVKILVMSTGMGGASVGIGVEELKNIGVKMMIRIGSCGALQDNIHIGDLIIANGAVRDEGASKAYIDTAYPAVPDPELMMSVIRVAEISGYRFHTGIIRSHDSFYTDREDEIDCYWSV